MDLAIHSIELHELTLLLFPKPGSAGTKTLKFFLKKSICKVHISEDPKKTCTNTSGVPLPTSSINISCIFIFYK